MLNVIICDEIIVFEGNAVPICCKNITLGDNGIAIWHRFWYP